MSPAVPSLLKLPLMSDVPLSVAVTPFVPSGQLVRFRVKGTHGVEAPAPTSVDV